MKVEKFKNTLSERLLLLDGAMGTMIQSFGFRDPHFRGNEFLSHKNELLGFNDILNLNQPEAIKSIHKEYLKAGCDIISTNTFNSNAISLKDYGFYNPAELIKRLNREGVLIAEKAIREYREESGESREIFVAGSIGPTNRSASMSPDISKPAARNITYDELFESYSTQIEGLIEGGADILLFETVFDTLNLKAGLDAAAQMFRKKGVHLPIMVSATISDGAGHLLSGQTLSAFVISVSGYEGVVSIGLNCGFGPEELSRFLNEISENSELFISCHPNAGLPDINGRYIVNPEKFREEIKLILGSGKVNVIGGCCGTTPSHIKELSKLLSGYKPYKPEKIKNGLRLSGLQPLVVTERNDFVIVGERCNVAGSRKFLRLIKEGNVTEAIALAERQVEEGAQILDINIDDPLLRGKEEMVSFLRYIGAEPEISKVPLMIDSSNWEVIEEALKNIQGKGIVNSLSLKEGEEIFKVRARRVRELGFALIVMAFDENGQADTFERKIEIAERAYKILTTECWFKPEDIIFDVNVMSVATGMSEHFRYAIDFIRAVEWIKKYLPGARTSGGISNLSFSFRGKNRIRDIMHTVFLYHAMNSGLDMAIINPSLALTYDEIDGTIRDVVEDIILARNPESETKLIEIALEETPDASALKKDEVRAEEISVEERLQLDMVKGNLKDLHSHLEEAAKIYDNPMSIIEGPLMAGMKRVGDLFAEGKMFLPQVVKTARVMSAAIDYLNPYILNLNSNEKTKAGTVLLATVKGDVHDIGKNIVSTVLACNNYDIIDLGVMVPDEDIIKTVKECRPDILCLSGLITPSLREMIKVVQGLEKNGIEIPVMVGGAATSAAHTALMISPEYKGPVLHVSDASQNPIAAARLLNPDSKEDFIAEINFRQEKIRKQYQQKEELILPFEEVLRISAKRDFTDIKSTVPATPLRKRVIKKLDAEKLVCLINWKMFFHAWRLTGEYLENFPYGLSDEEISVWEKGLKRESETKAKETISLYKSAKVLLEEVIFSSEFDGRAAVVFDEAFSEGDDIYFGEVKFPMLRQQREKSQFLCCSDFVGRKDEEKDYMGLFTVTAGRYIYKLINDSQKEGDEYRRLLLQTLADRIVEAASEWWHAEVRRKYWGYSPDENLDREELLGGKYQGIRPAWGYPMLPDQTMILQTETILPYKEMGMELTENGAILPQSSVSGIYISNPLARYFIVGEIGDDQIKSYSKARGISEERVREILRQL